MKTAQLKDSETMTAKEADRLILEAAKDDDGEFHLALVLARYMGLRVTELLHVRVGDVDWPKGTLKVLRVRTKTDSKEAVVVKCDCKSYGHQVALADIMPVPIAVKAVLGARLVALKDGTVNSWIFPSRQDGKKHMTRAGMSWTFKQLAKQTGLPRRRDGFASLRNLFLLDCLKSTKNKNPKNLQAAMRMHKRISATRLREKA